MRKYLISIAVDRVDIYDDEFGDLSLEGSLPVYWGVQDGITHARAFVAESTALRAVHRLNARLRELAPEIVLLHVIEDWVSATDIAERVGVSRETVRLWATGERGHGFPRPHAVVSGNQRIWAWSAVNAWLRAHKGLGDPHEVLNPAEAVRANEIIACIESAGDAFVPAGRSEGLRWSAPTAPVTRTALLALARQRRSEWNIVQHPIPRKPEVV